MPYKKIRPRKKVCYFKKNHIEHIDFKDVELLSRQRRGQLFHLSLRRGEDDDPLRVSFRE